MFSFLDIFYCFPGLRNMKGLFLPSNVLLGSFLLFSWLEKHERSVSAIKGSPSWIFSRLRKHERSVAAIKCSPSWIFSIVFLAWETRKVCCCHQMFSFLDLFHYFPGLRNMKGLLLPSNVLLLGSFLLFSWLEKHERSVAAIKCSPSWIFSIVFLSWETRKVCCCHQMFSFLDLFNCFPGLRNMKGLLLPSNVLLLGSFPLFSWLEKHERSVAAIKCSPSWIFSIVFLA